MSGLPTLSWGRHPRVAQGSHQPRLLKEAFAEISGSVLPYGNGRSYGDSCQSPGGTLILTRGFDRFISFDEETGVLECEPGVLLSEISDLALPRGWFLPVVPGTQFVTVGGAIANDIHGKNHRHMGSFGCHVIEIEVVRSDGRVITCNSRSNQGWLAATIGGLGLTGIITRAVLRLRRVEGAALNIWKFPFSSLEHFFELSRAHGDKEYTVAWIDSTATGRSLGRGIFSAGDHSKEAVTRNKPRKPFSIPLEPKFSLVNGITTRSFNFAYMRRARITGCVRSHYRQFLYPLDGVSNWNIIYGRRGFLQHQCVVPSDVAFPAIKEILERIQHASTGSFLTVLKQFGDIPSKGMLSFARPGTTFAIDFPNRGEVTLKLLEQLDAVAIQAGGAIYPAKDSRMSAETFSRSYPKLEEFRRFADPRLSSGLWRRVNSQ